MCGEVSGTRQCHNGLRREDNSYPYDVVQRLERECEKMVGTKISLISI